MSELRLSVPDDLVDAIATAVAAKLSGTMAGASTSPWLNAKAAADY